MAKVINKEEGAGVYTIRCAHPAGFYGLHRVDGCFSVIEITLDDIRASCDWEGDWTCSVICPACGQTLYPRWQIGEDAIRRVINRELKQKEK